MLERTPVLRGLMSQIHVYVHVHVCDIVHRGLMSQIHVHVYVCDISPVKVKQATSSYRQYFYYQISSCTCIYMCLHVRVTTNSSFWCSKYSFSFNQQISRYSLAFNEMLQLVSSEILNISSLFCCNQLLWMYMYIHVHVYTCTCILQQQPKFSNHPFSTPQG